MRLSSMKVRIGYIASLIILVSGCVDNNDLAEEFPSGNRDIVIVQERDPKLPVKSVNQPVVTDGDKIISRSSDENGAIIGNSDELLGYSYAVGNSILGDYANVRYPVVNIGKVKEFGTDYVSSKALKYYNLERFSYSNFDSYENKLSRTDKIATGLNLNIGLFKVGRKGTTESLFKSSITSSRNVVYGELSMTYYNSSFSLLATNRKFYARECLSPVFQKNLYSATIGDILNTYGDFILTGYMTGGKAFALYAGLGEENASSTSNEDKMDEDISCSVSWKNNSASASCNFGNSNASSESSVYKTSNTQTKLWIYGGRPVGLAMSGAADLKNVNFNLDSWVESLSDQNTHTIIDLAKNGIYPLSAFILEENFRRRMENTSLGFLAKNTRFITPYIEITRVFERYSKTSGEALYDIAAVLTTRQGDKIVLRSRDASTVTDDELSRNESASVFKDKAAMIAQEKQAYYDLAIRINPITRLNPCMGDPLSFDLGVVDESEMLVHSNPRSGIHYIYDKTNKIAFSYLVDTIDEDWILDDYGIRDWVESLPTKSISLATIANSYKIIGL